jgi:alpha-amylase
MGVILRAAYRQKQGISVPCPADKETPDAPWWYDHLKAHAAEIARRFTALMLPPIHKTQGGCSPGADGYAVYDEYDWGDKDQMGSIPTRFGTEAQLLACCRELQSAGVEIYADWVPHQRLGGRDGVYNTTGFPKTPGCFTGYDATGKLLPGRVPRDPIAGPVQFDSGVYGFGDELCPINGVPKDYVLNGLIAAAKRMQSQLGIKGWRDDDVKGQAVEAVRRWAAEIGGIVIGEYVDGPDTLSWWCFDSGLNGRCYAYDFPLQGALREMCNNSSNWPMYRLVSPNLCFANRSASHAVTFVESPDTDVNGAESVIWNKAMGYFFLLTFVGYPEIYWRDWSRDEGCYGYGLQDHINNYIWIHEHKAQGAFISRHGDFQHAVYERDGNLICGISNDRWNGWWTYHGPTNFGPNVHLHDFTGHNQMDCWTDENGWVTFGVPPNDNGLGTVAFGRAD